MKGSDGALAAANSEMEQAVNELSQAVGLATLRTVEIIGEVLQSMDGNVEFLVAKSTIIEERTEAIQSKQDEMTEVQRETLESVKGLSQMLYDGVGYIGSVQMGHDLAKDFQTSLLKFGVVRLRLTRWGQSVGLANLDEVKSLQQAKLSPEDIPRVEELLRGILDKFEDAEVTSKRFQKKKHNDQSSLLVLDPAKELDKVSASLNQKMYDLAKKRQGKAELEPKGDLTLYEEKNFSRLIEDISELVDGLVGLFPGIQEEQRRLVEEDVSEMNKAKDTLPLLKEVAAGQDKLLSEAVIKVMQSSSTTTYTNSVVFSGSNSGFQVGNNSGRVSGVRFG